VAARTQFLEAIKRKPDFVPPRYQLAEISLGQQKPKETMQFASEILAVQPNNTQAAILHAVGLMESGDLGLARAELTKLVKDSPNNTDAKLQLGLLAMREKRYQEAAAIFGKLQNGDARGGMALAAAYSSEKDLNKAFQILYDMLKKTPD